MRKLLLAFFRAILSEHLYIGIYLNDLMSLKLRLVVLHTANEINFAPRTKCIPWSHVTNIKHNQEFASPRGGEKAE